MSTTKYHHYSDVLVHFSAFVEALRDDGLEVFHHARDMSIPSLHICILRCIHVLKWYQDTPRVLTLMRHCTSLCRMLVCTAQPPLSRITSCDGPHHARNSQWSLIKRQHQDSPRVPPYLHTYHRYLDVLVHFSAFVEELSRFPIPTPIPTPTPTYRCVI